MKLRKNYRWVSPLRIADYIASQHQQWAFFYSAQQQTYSGNLSIIAYGLDNKIQGHDFEALEKALSNNQKTYDNTWFGYVGYEMKNALENLPTTQKNQLTFPSLSFSRYNNIILFHHDTQTIELWSNSNNIEDTIEKALEEKDIPNNTTTFNAPTLSSNMSKASYLEKVHLIQKEIKNGTLSQANLTRKFNGTLPNNLSAFTLFKNLCTLSPSPYSCFIQDEKRCIISSSPEKFISLDAHGNASTRPIKGTIPRNNDPILDQENFYLLQNSQKDKSENLMIVDLMRNDFSRSCESGTVTVPALFEVTTHPSIHHMSSTILGKKRADVSALSFFKNCFPPGSMTGTPKLKAIELCSQLEQEDRGVYSGAIAWFKGDGSFDSSVVIRTILVNDNHFEFQVGGAIVYDSSPEQEWLETIIKAKDICAALHYPLENLKAI